jgi:hypothetical protein
MVSFELLAIALILLFQPLIALLWLYIVYRLAVRFVFRRAERAVDGRIERAGNVLENLTGGSE